MSFNVISKSNSTISGTAKNNTKITGDKNDLDIKSSKDTWIAGDNNKGDINTTDDGRVAITGKNNKGLNVDASGADTGTLIMKGTGNTGTYTGSDGKNLVTLNGAGNRLLDDSVFGDSSDILKSSGGAKVDSLDLAGGNDLAMLASTDVNLQGGEGIDTAKVYNKKVTGKLTEFEKIQLMNQELGSEKASKYIQKNADGSYTLNGNLNIGKDSKNTKVAFSDGVFKSLAEWLGGKTTTTTGTGDLSATTNGDDSIDINAKDYGGKTLNLKAGNDKAFIEDGASNINIVGGAGEDTVQHGKNNANDYKNIAFADGKFTFTDGNNKTYTVDDSVENHKFNNTNFTVDQLKTFISPLAADANGVFNPTGTASKYNQAINLADTGKTAEFAADAKNYNVTGSGNVKLSQTLAELKKLVNYNSSNGVVNKFDFNGNTFNHTGKVTAVGTTYDTIQAFIKALFG